MRSLSAKERLLLHQLRLRNWAQAWDERSTPEEQPDPSGAAADSISERPAKWTLTEGITLREWQEGAVDAWFKAGRKGVVKVVTGAGKTTLALAIIERLQSEDPELRVAIVVPTIVLMNQWHDALLESSNLRPADIGRIGGGHESGFENEGKEPELAPRIVIAVLASARKYLPELTDREVTDHLLLIADECHRVGAPEMKRTLETRRSYSLGLSATPERSDDLDADQDLEEKPLGEIVFQMDFAEAITSGILPAFQVDHFGLGLSPTEAVRYSALSRSISEERKNLLAGSPSARKAGGGEALMAWARRVSTRGGDLAGSAARFVSETSKRKSLLYRAEARVAATVKLIEDAFAEREDARVILFHETIREVVELFDVLQDRQIPAVMEHSQLPPEMREISLELFRQGNAKVIVSAKSLIEGFNVPEADLGIIVASTSSPRQRIQSMGRVLRAKSTQDEAHATSRICILYVRDTVDESIYERADWEKLVGADRNSFFVWDPPDAPNPADGPPRSVVPSEVDIDIEALDPGDEWPGRYDGDEFSVDTKGNVGSVDGEFATNPQSVPNAVIEFKGSAGKFKVTPKNRAILVLVSSESGNWTTVFCGRLAEPFRFERVATDAPADVEELSPGDVYSGPEKPSTELRFRQRRGGVITKRDGSREIYASGVDAERIVGILRELRNRGESVTTFRVNEIGHAFWFQDGKQRFIAADASGMFGD